MSLLGLTTHLKKKKTKPNNPNNHNRKNYNKDNNVLYTCIHP